MKVLHYEGDPVLDAETQASVDEIMQQLLPLSPTWCHCIWFKRGHENEDHSGSVASTQGDWCYHFAVIFIRADRWRKLSLYERRNTLIHELHHIINGPHHEFARQTLEKLLPSDKDHPLRQTILQQLSEHVEFATEDFAVGVQKLMGWDQ